MKPEDVPEELVQAFGEAWEKASRVIWAAGPPPGFRRRAGLAAVMTIVQRDYVSRWGQVEQTISEEMAEDPGVMTYFRDFIPRRARVMGATVMDIDQPEITPLRDEDGRLTGLISYCWRIRRD